MRDEQAKCLSTRTRPDGVVLRRYLMHDGSRETTAEIPISVLRALSPGRLAERLERAARERERQAARSARDRLILARSEESSRAVAALAGCSEFTVRRVRSTERRTKT